MDAWEECCKIRGRALDKIRAVLRDRKRVPKEQILRIIDEALEENRRARQRAEELYKIIAALGKDDGALQEQIMRIVDEAKKDGSAKNADDDEEEYI